MNPKIKVLFVDDDPQNLFLFKKLFISKFEVLTTETGHHGIELLKENHNIQIVFSDLQMPIMDGLEFINTAKKQHPDKEYYLITSSDFTPRIQQALDSNLISGYIQKPFNVKRVTEAIEKKIKVQF